MKDKLENQMKEYIENIEQLGADARYDFDLEYLGQLRIKLESIEWWAKKAQKVLDKIEKEEENKENE